MYRTLLMIILLSGGTCTSCQLNDENRPEPPEEKETKDSTFYRGADLSYVNEMEDCGAVYYDEQGEEKSPYQIFEEAGTDLVRLRLWHNPDWTDYSDFEDVKKAIAKAKSLDMEVLLDFHYSDDWADPQKQKVPAAWLPVVGNMQVLGDSVYNYTFTVLEKLHESDLMPEFVQVGNETNIEILQDPDGEYGQINWGRNAFLINKGLQAVRDAATQFDEEVQSFLHIAQPENALWWFEEAQQHGVTDYDWIGISYYPKWSEYGLNELPAAIKTLTATYGKQLMVVETAYPYTLDNADAAGNILGQDAVIPGYAISPQGQYDYLRALEQKIIEGGGSGLIYWEPAWVSTSCSTRWGQGSHWDNATSFDQNNRAHVGMRYYKGE
ncbi:MAG TPA: glycosyl hydrolase 53 family protein [Phaeodactylibacter sp.]|nr:glycosyl hydrolase 53 family protein [Phaeodactylibacter sp.]